MGIDPQGDRYICVSQHLKDHLGMNTPPQEQRGSGVSQTVKVQIGQASRLQYPLEVALGEIVRDHQPTDGIRKYEVLSSISGGAAPESFLLLTDTIDTQRLDCCRGKGNAAPGICCLWLGVLAACGLVAI
jgi:hypothetical protein